MPRICQEHWDKLRAAIDSRGLTPLIAKSAEAAVENTVREIEGRATKAEFDPLMAANWAILGLFLRGLGPAGGLAAMCDATLCPLCEVERGSAGMAENWINGCADQILAHARDLGLVPAAQ